MAQLVRDESNEKQADVRVSNIQAAKGIFDLIRTSLGPRGLDKMVTTPKGDVLITNDGATIMKQLEARHPAARMLIELSQSQDIEAGDGTTTVVVLAGRLLSNCLDLFKLGIHPTAISEAYQAACDEAVKVVMSIARPIDLKNREELINICKTTLSSKVITNHSAHLAPLILDSVLRVSEHDNVDLSRIHVIKRLGGTVDESMLTTGLAFARRPTEGPGFCEKVKLGIARFCISPPKTDMEANLIVHDSDAIDRLLEQERKLTAKMCKKIASAGCNVLLLQKSIMREAVSDMALHFLKKLKVTVIDDIEREEIEFIATTTGATPVATIDEFTSDKLGSMGELTVVDGVTYISRDPANEAENVKTCTIIVRGANKLILDEAVRSVHDGLCAVRCLVKKGFIIPGGAAVETEIARCLYERSHSQTGVGQYCMRAFADAFEIIPLTLAENAGLSPITTLTELRRVHKEGGTTYGLDITRGGEISEMFSLNIIQPALVTISAITLATETTRMLLKIDDIVLGR